MDMKLSIITINRNNAAGLRKTMESVFTQTYRDFEYIVVDGASTDDSLDVIKEYESVHSLNVHSFNFTWLSEPDTGIYNAMNKGLRMSHGEYTLMLNSGDFLVDEKVLNHILPELDGTDIIQGNLISEKEGNEIVNRGYGKSEIDIFDILKGNFLHQASFCKKELFEKFGYFDESYRSSADTKFFMECLGRHDATYRYIDLDITNYDLTGISADKSEKWVRCREEELDRIIKEVFSKRIYAFMQENDKKVRLYNELHTHKLIWNITMFLAYVGSKMFNKES